jgi:hypothetical protein
MERCGLRVQPGNHICTPRSVREWTHTFPSGLSFWELESLWSFEFQISISGVKTHWIEELFIPLENSWNVECKIGLHDPFEYLKHKLWKKKGQESKYQFDSHPLKVGNFFEICCCRWHATYMVGKLLMRGTPLLQSKVCIRSYDLPKCQESQFWEFQDSQLGNPRTKWHLDAAPMVNHREFYKGEGGGFPPTSGRGEFCEFVYARGSSMH